jgi:hypothetical protein
LSAAVATAATVAASIAACPALLLPLLLSLSLLIALALLPTRRAPYPLLLHVKRRRCFKGFGVQIDCPIFATINSSFVKSYVSMEWPKVSSEWSKVRSKLFYGMAKSINPIGQKYLREWSKDFEGWRAVQPLNFCIDLAVQFYYIFLQPFFMFCTFTQHSRELS